MKNEKKCLVYRLVGYNVIWLVILKKCHNFVFCQNSKLWWNVSQSVKLITDFKIADKFDFKIAFW